MNPIEVPLSENFSGRIMGVVQRNGKVCILSGDPAVVWAISLTGPVCGESWHFTGDDIRHPVVQLSKKLRGFNLVGFMYINRTSVEIIEQTMKSGFAHSSNVFQNLIAEVPIHAEQIHDFPAVGLKLEKRRYGEDIDDILLVVHPTSLLNSVEIHRWLEEE